MSSGFITRVEHEKDEPYTVIFQTDDADKYKHIEDECRKMIGHAKPTVYDELVKALRNCSDGVCSLCPYDDHELSTKGCEAKLMHDAADALEAAEKRIAELMPKQGEWIMCESEKPYIVCKCSVCGVMTSEYGHYCPNCGAKMKGANDEQIH